MGGVRPVSILMSLTLTSRKTCLEMLNSMSILHPHIAAALHWVEHPIDNLECNEAVGAEIATVILGDVEPSYRRFRLIELGFGWEALLHGEREAPKLLQLPFLRARSVPVEKLKQKPCLIVDGFPAAVSFREIKAVFSSWEGFCGVAAREELEVLTVYVWWSDKHAAQVARVAMLKLLFDSAAPCPLRVFQPEAWLLDKTPPIAYT